MRARVLETVLHRLANPVDPGAPEEILHRALEALHDTLRAEGLALYARDATGRLTREAHRLRLREVDRPDGEDSALAEAGQDPLEEAETLAQLGLGGSVSATDLQGLREAGVALLGLPGNYRLGLPLQTDGEVPAVLLAACYETPRQARRDQKTLEALRPLLAVSLLPTLRLLQVEHAATEAARRSRAEREALSIAVDGSRLTEALLHLAAQAARFEGGFFAEHQDGALRLRTAVEVPSAFPPEGTDLTQGLLQLDQIGDVSMVTAGEADTLAQAGVARILALPIHVEGTLAGVVGLVTASPVATPDEAGLGVLQLYASQFQAVLARQRDMARLGASYFASLCALADGLDMAAPSTRGHSGRVAAFADAIADALGDLDGEMREALTQAARVHDVGLFAGPGQALAVSAEFRHPVLGAELASLLPKGEQVARAVAEHHETHDGVGFPAGRSGDEISRLGQILAVAEFLAERTARSAVAGAWSLAEAAERVADESGRRFAPDIAAAAATACRNLAAAQPRCVAAKACPETIRSACPAARADAPCYHVPDTACARHGDPDCLGCTVYRTWGAPAPPRGGPQ